MIKLIGRDIISIIWGRTYPGGTHWACYTHWARFAYRPGGHAPTSNFLKSAKKNKIHLAVMELLIIALYDMIFTQSLRNLYASIFISYLSYPFPRR